MQRSDPVILSVTNQKGGVGKTTTTINLGASMAALGYNVILIDGDPQGNASTGVGVATKDRTPSTYDLLMGTARLEDAVQSTKIKGLGIVPATGDLSSIDLELSQSSGRTRRFKESIRLLPADTADLILFDCPPSLNLLTVNALAASTGVLIPLQCEFFALEGISQLLKTIGEVRTSLNPALTTQGIVLTMYDSRNNLTIDVETDVRDTLGSLVCQTVIPRNVRLSEAPSHGIPVCLYDPRSAGAQAYESLAKELAVRLFSSPTVNSVEKV